MGNETIFRVVNKNDANEFKNLNAQGFYEHLGYTKTDQILYKRWIGEI